MNAFTFVLLITVIVLLVALLVARRRMRELTRSPRTVVSSATSDQTPVNAAFQLAPLGVVIVDETGQRIFENDASRAYTAATGEDALVSLRLRNLLAAAAEATESAEQEIELHGPTPRTIRLQAHPLYEGTRHIGIAAFIDETTARSQIDAIRSDFIANASHELKTPLGAIRLLAEALVATPDPLVARGLAEKIEAEAERINRLIEDILDLAILESARSEAVEVDLRDVIDDVVMQTRTFSETVGIAINHTAEPLVVMGDRRRLTSAVANLVENALSFTAVRGNEEQSPVEVRLRSQGKKAVIEVEDHGIGIPERHQERIFERFYRVDRGRSRASGGTGLGLSIARHVVENHGGTISVRSVPGEGSIFRIELPAVEA